MGQIKFIGSMLMTGLFALAIVVFAMNFGSDNNSAVLLSEDPQMNNLKDQIINNASQFKEDSLTSTEDFASSTIGTSTVSEAGGQFKVGVGTGISMVTTSLSVGYSKIFGNDNSFGIFFTVLIFFLSYIGALYAYKAWVGRDPD